MKPATHPGVRIGTVVTALIALLPYFRDFFITAYLAGAFTAVWFEIRKRTLSLGDGAQLGFLSGFYGLLLAGTVYDLVWETFHYQLWRIENADRVIGLFFHMLQDATTPSVWILITLQIILAAICAGAFGAPAGILAVKIFRRS